MKKGFALVIVLALALGSFSAVKAEETNKIGDVVNVKLGDDSWGVKVTSYVEKPSTSSQKQIEVSLTFINLSGQKVQVINPDQWKFYAIGADGNSFKSDQYYRDPGKVTWLSKEDVLAAAAFPVRIIVDTPKEFFTKQFAVMSDVGIPSHIAVDIPSSLVARPSALPISEGPVGASAPAGTTSAVPKPSSAGTGIEEQAQAGYGLMIGHTLGISGVYWAMPQLGGQVIVDRKGTSDLGVNARLLLKFFAMPFGRLYLAPEVGYQFTAYGGAVSKTYYGYLAGAEFIMPFPVTVAGEKRLIKGLDWLSFFAFEKAKAIGVSAELGFFGTDVRNINLSPDKLSPGVTMAGHIYL